MSSRRRALAVLAFIVGLCATLEALSRALPLDAVANRALFKLALLERSGPAATLVLGSSRANDCVDPSAFGGRGFNLATPSSSLQTLQFIARSAASTPGVRLALIELSAPQWHDAPFTPLLPVTAGDPLGRLLETHSFLLQRRRALSIEHWSRLPALAFPGGYDGTEFFRTRWVSESWVKVTAPDSLLELSSGYITPVDDARVLDGYRQVVDAFRSRGVKVVLFSTPAASECSSAARGLRQRTAERLGVPYFDFTCSEVPAGTLADGREHCGAQGRHLFSLSLAHVLH